ncbi:hypothetical protein KSP35_08855 [Aquihabitans sp. G128]|uniref:hypothetical protein n=1 Tax=Aquihabitans sp. G128 TaxID=2849779 RepID=UPI001C224BDC|nr:hypothetical protein [Aquihabitans sp. G128]QXC62872.1 hypothetical protein KSP35_08855 [Aquihabitans sp. G128]
MFRRRTPTAAAPPDTAAPATEPSGAPAEDAGGLAARLGEAGWVLPRGLAEGAPPRWTLIGTVASPTATAVDPTGLVVGEGWSLDWWVGADDRWHLPPQEAAVRQQLVDEAPVVETLVRIPGGDAVHRAYGFRSPRPIGDEWVGVEVENATAVPFAVALVLRPLVADAVGAASRITIEPTEGGTGRDVAHLVRIDGRPVLVVPRKPNHLAVGSHELGDVAAVVTSGAAGTELVAADCPDGLATLALIYPLPHTAVLRVAVPVGEVGTDPVPYPAVLPDAATVASGWEVHRRGPRFEIPERRLALATERARAQIHLAHDGTAVRRDGHRMPDLEPGATEVLLGAFDLLDRPADVGTVVARWIERLVDPTPEVDALALAVIARHWRLHRIDALLDWMLPEVAAAVERLDRAHRKGHLTGTASRRRAADALASAATMLTAAGQPGAGTSVAALAGRVAADLPEPTPATAADHLVLLAGRIAGGDAAAVTELDHVVVAASPTGTWAGPGPGGRPSGHDLVAAAAVVAAARSLLVAERPDGLALLPVHPESWYGGGIELHDAPTDFGRLSFAVRWHGIRPALLWELEPHPGLAPVRLTIPGLDPTWSTTELRGDALLAEVAPPAGLDQLTLVSEHPDILPEMRKPGSAPDEPEPPTIPEGGTFS